MPARAGAGGVPEDLGVHVGVAVDEARRDDAPFGVDLARRADALEMIAAVRRRYERRIAFERVPAAAAAPGVREQ